MTKNLKNLHQNIGKFCFEALGGLKNEKRQEGVSPWTIAGKLLLSNEVTLPSSYEKL